MGVKEEAHDKLSSIFQRSGVRSVFEDSVVMKSPTLIVLLVARSPPPGTLRLEIPVGVGVDSQEYTMGPKKDCCQATLLEQSSE